MMRTRTKILLALAAAVAALAAVLLVNVWLLPPLPAPGVQTHAPRQATFDAAAAAGRLSAALRVPTVSSEQAGAPPADFPAMHRLLEQQFPLVHAHLEREIVGGASLLYTWHGTAPELEPVLLTAHMDVVPVAADTLGKWRYPPFAGMVADGYIWGRGAMDMKSTLMATLEAVEATLRQGQAPRRTVLLAFGHDEELGGRQGAAAIAALLAQRGVKAQFSLDEGAFVLERFFPGVERPVAQIGLAEKGYLSLALEANAPGGHSSVPPPETAIGRIGRAVARIEANPLPPQLDGPGPQGLKALAPALPWPMRVALANDKLLGPVLVRALAARPATNAMMRTTAVPTMIQGGVKDNVLPSTASAVVNFRLAPGDTIAGVYAHVRGAIDDPAVRVSQYGASAAEATEIASLETAGGRALAEVIGRRVPGAIVIPGLVVGGTDTRHYGRVSNAPYRFTPLRLTPADVARFHGVDERISLANYAEMIAFQIDLIATATR